MVLVVVVVPAVLAWRLVFSVVAELAAAAAAVTVLEDESPPARPFLELTSGDPTIILLSTMDDALRLGVDLCFCKAEKKTSG